MVPPLNESEQGEELSNLLYNIALENVFGRTGVQSNESIIILEIERMAVEDAFVPLKKETVRIGLTEVCALYSIVK